MKHKQHLWILVFTVAIAGSHGSAAAWSSAHRQNFISSCVDAANTPTERDRLLQECPCVAREMEARISDERLIQLSNMPAGKEKAEAVTPLLQDAKAKCDSRGAK